MRVYLDFEKDTDSTSVFMREQCVKIFSSRTALKAPKQPNGRLVCACSHHEWKKTVSEAWPSWLIVYRPPSDQVIRILTGSMSTGRFRHVS